MNRRTLLKGLLGSTVLSAAPSSGIVDAHVHFYDPNRPQGIPWPTSKTDPLYRPCLPGPWARMVRPLGVTGAIVVEASAWLEDNQWVLDLAKEHPVIKGFVGHLEPGASGFRDHLARFGKNPLFRGIRLGEGPLRAALNDSATMADLERLADADLALDALGGGTMLTDVATLAGRLPRLRIVVDHLPFEAPAGAIESLREHPLVYAKVSGVMRRIDGRVPEDLDFYRASIDQVWNVFGPDRVIYASNWPVCELLAPYATVLKIVHEHFAAKGPSASDRYFRLNSAAAYKWPA